jgi:hypothetical protein
MNFQMAKANSKDKEIHGSSENVVKIQIYFSVLTPKKLSNNADENDGVVLTRFKRRYCYE